MRDETAHEWGTRQRQFLSTEALSVAEERRGRDLCISLVAAQTFVQPRTKYRVLSTPQTVRLSAPVEITPPWERHRFAVIGVLAGAVYLLVCR